METFAETLATFAAGLSPSRVPRAVAEQATRLLLDTAGVTLAAVPKVGVPREQAMREVEEETGLDARCYDLRDWQLQNQYEIYPEWRWRYAPGVTQNTEHVFGLALPQPLEVRLAPREHLRFLWLPWEEAAGRCFSWSNAQAIGHLASRSN